MATKLDDPNSLNVSDSDYHRKFDLEKHPVLPEGIAPHEGAIDQARARLQAGETNATAPPQSQSPQTAGSDATEGSGPISLRKRFSGLINRRRAFFGGGTALLITIIIAIAAISPFGIFIHAKEVLSQWNLSDKSYSRRMIGLYQKRYFTNPTSCKGAKIICRLMPGISEKEFKQLEKAGLQPKRDPTGKYVVSFTIKGLDGKPETVTGANFATVFKTNPELRAGFDRLATPKTSKMRNPFTVDEVFRKLRINRKNPIGDSTNKQDMEQAMRHSTMGQGIDPDTGRPIVDENDSQQDIDKMSKQLGGLEVASQDIADKIREAMGPNLENPVPIESVPDAGVVDSADKALFVATNATQSGLKGAAFGWFNGIDSACTFKQAMYATEILAKIYKARALIKYAGVIMTIADKVKVGDDVPAEGAAVASQALFADTVSAADNSYSQAAFIGSLMTAPSRKPESKGLTFSDSPGWTLATQGKVKSRAALARFTSGGVFMRSLVKFNDFLAAKGVTTQTCKQVKSWYGQAALLIGGIITTVFTFGIGAVAGVAEGLLFGAAMGVLWAFAVPQLAQMASGTSVPDPNNDPEGSFGVGTALVFGVSAMDALIDRVNGARPLKESEYRHIALESVADRRMADAAEAINNPVKWYSLDNSKSFASQLSLAMLPLATKLNAGQTSGALAQLASLPSLSFGKLLTTTQAAQQIDVFRSDLCVDSDYKEVGLATNAGCYPLYGEWDSISEEDPVAISTYMVNNGYADGETGEAKGDYQDFIESCINSDEPIGPGSETEKCMRTDEQYRNFRGFRAITTGHSAIEARVNGTLGQGSAPAGQPPGDNGGTENPSAAGLQWPIKLADWPKGNIVSEACYLGYKTLPGDHTGMDISVVNKPVYAAGDGKVTMISPSYGAINIQHGPKLFTNYQHLSSFTVGKDAIVKRGQQIGTSGERNSPGGPHLHFGVWFTNRFVSADDKDVRQVTGDPLKYMPADRNTAPCTPL